MDIEDRGRILPVILSAALPPKKVVMRRSLSWFASIAVLLTSANALGGGDAHVSLVPWKVLETGDRTRNAALVLFWIPASQDELRRSPLLTSEELTLFSSHCVAMRIVRLDDRETLNRLGVNDELPLAVLTAADGAVIGRANARNAAEVERLVREELEGRALAAEAMLDEAREKAEEGEIAAAAEIYRQVRAQKCVCPRQARAAQRALRKLEK